MVIEALNVESWLGLEREGQRQAVMSPSAALTVAGECEESLVVTPCHVRERVKSEVHFRSVVKMMKRSLTLQGAHSFSLTFI